MSLSIKRLPPSASRPDHPLTPSACSGARVEELDGVVFRTAVESSSSYLRLVVVVVGGGITWESGLGARRSGVRDVDKAVDGEDNSSTVPTGSGIVYISLSLIHSLPSENAHCNLGVARRDSLPDRRGYEIDFRWLGLIGLTCRCRHRRAGTHPATRPACRRQLPGRRCRAPAVPAHPGTSYGCHERRS